MNNRDYGTILQFIKEKAPAGLELLYERYGRPFHKYALDRWNMGEEEAWEIVYKTLETLVLKLPSYEFENQAKFDAFLFKVFVNFLRQRHREMRSKQLPQLEFFDMDKEFVLPGYVQEALTKRAFDDYYGSEVLENPQLRLLKASLEQLTPVDKDLLLLRAQNYSYDEIAALLGIENKQLKVKYHRAKEKLINLLNEMKL
jgi:RNA polymerase sigma factor (sigma-70 family)